MSEKEEDVGYHKKQTSRTTTSITRIWNENSHLIRTENQATAWNIRKEQWREEYAQILHPCRIQVNPEVHWEHISA
jgi:hypothetical protein